MFFKLNSFWSFVGATLTLVALYLILKNSKGFSEVIRSGFSSYGGFLGVLQGRTYNGVSG